MDVYIKTQYSVGFAEIEVGKELSGIRFQQDNHEFEAEFIERDPEKNYYKQCPMDVSLISFHQDIPNKLPKVFEKLAEGFVPEEGCVAKTFEDLKHKGGPLYNIDFYPANLRNFLDPIHDAHEQSMKRIHTFLSWRCKSERDFHFVSKLERPKGSFDRNHWFNLPPCYRITGSILPAPPMLNEEFTCESELTSFLANPELSPIPIELIYEARKILTTGNSRSALVIAVSALEVRLKVFITNMSPSSKWLVDNLQTPPVEKLLREYVPLLLEKPDKYLDSVNPILGEIKKAIKVRNDVTHKGHGPNTRKVDKFINQIENTIRLLDAEEGHTWSLSDHVKQT